jgi:hypothetical protein
MWTRKGLRPETVMWPASGQCMAVAAGVRANERGVAEANERVHPLPQPYTETK